MSIAIIGAAGQLGRELCVQLGSEAVPFTHHEIELTDHASLTRAIEPLAPCTVINAAAFNLVDDAETRPADALAVNALGVRELSLVCRDLACMLVHFSTDYVFGLEQDRPSPYDESAFPGPINVYGTSKLAGEWFVRSICPRHLVLRTCGLYGLPSAGGKGRNFVETMLRVGGERGHVRVVADQVCTPTYTADLAQATILLLGTDAHGLYHWTNSGSSSWHEFASEIFRLAAMPVECTPIRTEEYGAKAARPRYSVLTSRRLRTVGMSEPRHWKEALHAYLGARSARSAQGQSQTKDQ